MVVSKIIFNIFCSSTFPLVFKENNATTELKYTLQALYSSYVAYLKWIAWCWRCCISGCSSANQRSTANWTTSSSRCSVQWNGQHILHSHPFECSFIWKLLMCLQQNIRVTVSMRLIMFMQIIEPNLLLNYYLRNGVLNYRFTIVARILQPGGCISLVWLLNSFDLCCKLNVAKRMPRNAESDNLSEYL